MDLVCLNCTDWRENIDKAEAPRTLLQARNPGTWRYDGKTFKFCPWCATELVINPTKSTLQYDRHGPSPT